MRLKRRIALLGTPFAGESGLELEIAADQFEKLLAHLNQFIIMDDVELVPLGEEQVGEAGSETAIGLTGPLADEVLERVGLPVIVKRDGGNQRGVERLGPENSARLRRAGAALRILAADGRAAEAVVVPAHGGAMPVGCAALEAFRIAEGIPLYGIDIVERDLPQETSQMRALHFSQRLLPGPGDRGAHPFARQCASRICGRWNFRAGACRRRRADALKTGGRRATSPARRSCRSRRRAGICAGHDSG